MKCYRYNMYGVLYNTQYIQVYYSNQKKKINQIAIFTKNKKETNGYSRYNMSKNLQSDIIMLLALAPVRRVIIVAHSQVDDDDRLSVDYWLIHINKKVVNFIICE